MELLQTIWTTLTTQNEALIQIISIPLTFLEIYLYTLLFTTILNISKNKKQVIVYVITFSLITIFLNNFISKIYSGFLSLIICPILLIAIFKINFLKSIIAEILPLVISSIAEILITKLGLITFNLSYELIASIPIYRLSSVCLIYLILYGIYYICKHFSLNISLADWMDKKSKILMIINLLIGIITIATQLFLANFYNENLPIAITLLSILTMMAYFFTSLFSISRTTKLQMTEQSLEEAKLYNKSLKILHDNVRAFKHDFSNIVQAIGGYIGTNDMEGLKVYYDQLLGDCQKVNNLYTLSPEVINNPAIYSLLASKYHIADELGISIHMEIFLNLNELNMKIYEFTRILGILMDNAIEASKECEQKIINVEIRKDFKVNRQILLIENTYQDKDIDLEHIFEKGYTSKPHNTGLGLWEIREILKKNKNLNLYTTKNDIFFKQQLEIYQK